MSEYVGREVVGSEEDVALRLLEAKRGFLGQNLG